MIPDYTIITTTTTKNPSLIKVSRFNHNRFYRFNLLRKKILKQIIEDVLLRFD